MILEITQGGFIKVKNCKVLCVRLWGLDIFFHNSLHLSARTYSSFDSRTWVGQWLLDAVIGGWQDTE